MSKSLQRRQPSGSPDGRGTAFLIGAGSVLALFLGIFVFTHLFYILFTVAVCLVVIGLVKARRR